MAAVGDVYHWSLLVFLIGDTAPYTVNTDGTFQRLEIIQTVSTLATVAGQPGPGAKAYIFVIETCANYEWFPGDLTATDGWRVLGHTGGSVGCWKLVGDAITIQPIGGTSDDWVRLFGAGGAAAAMAYHGKIILGAGTWLCKTAWQMPSGTHIECEAGVTIISSLTPGSGGFVNFPFWKFTLFGAAGTLTAAPTFGSNQVSSTVSYAVDTWVWIGQTGGLGHSFLAMQYRVMAVAGGGPYTLTLDRAILFPFSNGENIKAISSQTRDIILDGNGATIKGTGDRLFEFTGPYRCHIKNWYIPKGTGAVITSGVSVDIGALDTTVEDVTVDGGASYAFTLECSERCEIIDCSADNVGQGFSVWDSADCAVVDCSSSVTTNAGVQIGTNLMTVGCYKCIVRGGSFSKGTNVGIDFAYSTDCLVDGASAENNAVGISTGTTSTRLRIRDCVTKRNTTYGVQNNSPGTRIIGQRSDNDNYAVALFAAASVEEIDANDYTQFGVYVDGTIPARSIVNVRGGNLKSTRSGSNCSRVYGPAWVNYDGVKLENLAVDASQSAIIAVNAAACTLVVKDCIATQASASNGIVNQAGGNTVNLEGHNDFDSLTTPYITTAGSITNVTQGGVTAKSLAGGDVTLTFSEAQGLSLRCNGNPGANRNIIVPTQDGMLWDVSNEFGTANTVTVKTAAGAGIAIAQGKNAWVRCDGTNVVRVTADT